MTITCQRAACASYASTMSPAHQQHHPSLPLPLPLPLLRLRRQSRCHHRTPPAVLHAQVIHGVHTPAAGTITATQMGQKATIPAINSARPLLSAGQSQTSRVLSALISSRLQAHPRRAGCSWSCISWRCRFSRTSAAPNRQAVLTADRDGVGSMAQTPAT